MRGFRKKIRLAKKVTAGVVLLLPVVLLLDGCALTGPSIRPPDGAQGRVLKMETTGYCSCGKCCGWKRNWIGRPVYSSGPSKGKPKKVGITASGSRARRGTVAADTRYYPLGTVMYVEGYGYARVEDRGGAIKGRNRLDLYFPSHRQALKWGRKTVRVKVW